MAHRQQKVNQAYQRKRQQKPGEVNQVIHHDITFFLSAW